MNVKRILEFFFILMKFICRTQAEYFVEKVYPLVPAPEWANICPESQTVCCQGFIFLLNSCVGKLKGQSIFFNI